MLWETVSFLGSCVYAADATFSGYFGNDCSGAVWFQSTESETFSSCTEFHSYLVEQCNDSNGAECNLPDFPICLGADVDWIQSEYGITMGFICIDTTDPPTAPATEFTCSDNIQNGDEEGVDCGGSCLLQCRSTCDTFLDCGESHYLRYNAVDIKCATHECNIGDDLDTCCKARALCSELLYCFGQVLISAADSTYCVTDSCSFNDISRCCADASSCAGFELCDSETQYLRDEAENLYCSSEQCGPADKVKCCADKETCDRYICSYFDGLVNVQNGESIYCQYDDCNEDPDVVSTCCENRASCVGFICDDSMFVDKSDKNTSLCPKATCESNAWVTCCDVKQKCLELPFYAYTCSPSAKYGLSPNAENLYCNGRLCESPRDDAFCCINTPAPAISPTPEPVAPVATPATVAPTPTPVETPTSEIATPVEIPTPAPVENATPVETPTSAPTETPTPETATPVEPPTPEAFGTDTPTLEPAGLEEAVKSNGGSGLSSVEKGLIGAGCAVFVVGGAELYRRRRNQSKTTRGALIEM